MNEERASRSVKIRQSAVTTYVAAYPLSLSPLCTQRQFIMNLIKPSFSLHLASRVTKQALQSAEVRVTKNKDIHKSKQTVRQQVKLYFSKGLLPNPNHLPRSVA